MLEVAIRRRLRLPLPILHKHCEGKSCVHDVDVYGDYRATCMRSGRVQIRASTVEKVWSRVFREAGAVVKRSKLIRDMHVGDMRANQHNLDQRRIDIVAYGLPIFNGLPIACDDTMVSPLTGAGVPVPNACKEEGAAMQVARERKQKQYPEFFNQVVPRAKFLVLPCEVGGRWGDECIELVKLLAKCRVQSVPKVLRRSLVSCAVQRGNSALLLRSGCTRPLRGRGWTSRWSGSPLTQALFLCSC